MDNGFFLVVKIMRGRNVQIARLGGGEEAQKNLILRPGLKRRGEFVHSVSQMWQQAGAENNRVGVTHRIQPDAGLRQAPGLVLEQARGGHLAAHRVDPRPVLGRRAGTDERALGVDGFGVAENKTEPLVLLDGGEQRINRTVGNHVLGELKFQKLPRAEGQGEQPVVRQRNGARRGENFQVQPALPGFKNFQRVVGAGIVHGHDFEAGRVLALDGGEEPVELRRVVVNRDADGQAADSFRRGFFRRTH